MTVINTLLEITIYSAVLLGAILLFRLLLKKRISPAIRYAAWFLIVARLLMPVTVASGFSLIVIPSAPSTAQLQNASISALPGDEAVQTGDATAASDAPAFDTAADAAAPYHASADTASAPVPSNPAPFTWKWDNTLLGLWLVGAAFVMLHTAITSVRLKKRLMKGALAPPEEWQRIAEQVQSELGIRGKIKLIMLRDLASPALSASLRPTVAMPLQMLWHDKAQAEFALRHELMHLKRKDHLVCLLLMLLKAVYWFNPVVWIMAAMMKRDMETACDSMVVQPMSKAEKKQYAATIIDMYAQEPSRFVLGMALGGPKQSAERRVRGIFMRSRSSLGVRMSAFLLTGIMLMACFTTACQPVLEENVTAENNPAGMTLVAAQAPKAAAETISESAAEPEAAQVTYNTVDRWQESFSAGAVNVTIDADIMMPEMPAIPVYQVSHVEFTPQDVDNAIATFAQNAEIHNYDAFTRSAVDTMIAEYQKSIDELNAGNLPPDDDRSAQEQIADLKVIIQQLEADYANAAEDDVLSGPAVTTFRQDGNGNAVKLYIRDANGGEHKLIVENSKDGSSMYFTDYFDVYFKYVSKEDAEKYVSSGELDLNQAKSLAAQVMESLGIKNAYMYNTEIMSTEASSPEDESPMYELSYTRAFGRLPAIPESFIPAPLSSENTQTPEIKAPEPERISIITDGVRIYSFTWMSPYVNQKMIEENAETLSVEEARKLLRLQMEAVAQSESDLWSDMYNNMQINVTQINMSSFYMPASDGTNTYIMIPIWDMVGSKVYTNGTAQLADAEEGSEIISASQYASDNSLISFVTLNALSGSIINRELGY